MSIRPLLAAVESFLAKAYGFLQKDSLVLRFFFRRFLWFSARERTKISCLMSSSNTCIPIFSCCGASFSWRFSCRCLALNWSFLTWRRFGCFKPSLFFLLTSSPNFSRHRLWTISQKALSCFAVDPLRRIVRVVESSWWSRAQAELWFPLGRWIVTLLGNAPGCAGAAMGSGTLWWLSGFEIPSFDLFSRRGLRCCLHLRVGWMRRSGWMVRFLLRLLCVVASFRAGSSFWDPWVVYSPSPLQPPWGHFSLLTDVVRVILVAD